MADDVRRTSEADEQFGQRLADDLPDLDRDRYRRARSRRRRRGSAICLFDGRPRS
jgi:hypothetical protein